MSEIKLKASTVKLILETLGDVATQDKVLLLGLQVNGEIKDDAGIVHVSPNWLVNAVAKFAEAHKKITKDIVEAVGE